MRRDDGIQPRHRKAPPSLAPIIGQVLHAHLALGVHLKYGVDIICTTCHIMKVDWIVEIGDEFEPEFDALHEDVQTEMLALTRLLQQFGPHLGRPRVDTLSGSRHANMKELLLRKADERFAARLARLKKEGQESWL